MKTLHKALSWSGCVAALLTLTAVTALVGCSGDKTTSTAPTAEVQTSGQTPSETSQTTLPERVALSAEKEPVDGTDRTGTGEVICGQGLLTIPLVLGNITYVGAGASKAQIAVYKQGTLGVTIEISDGPSVLYALIVDGEATTIIPRELRVAPSSILGLDFTEWGNSIEKVVACTSVE